MTQLDLLDHKILAPFPTSEEAHSALEYKHTAYIHSARQFALQWLESHPGCDVDVIREHLPPPPNSDLRLMGAIFNKTTFEKFDTRRSTRPECHKREISCFRLRRTT